jgi:hypothetical protein
MDLTLREVDWIKFCMIGMGSEGTEMVRKI